MRELLGKTWLVYLALCVVSIIIYWPGLRGPFVFDDVPGMVQNPAVADAPTPQLALTITGPSDTAAYGRPLIATFWWAQWHMGNGSPTLFHLVSLLLHMANCVLVLSLLKRMLRPEDRPFAVWIAMVWAFHPLLSEAVLYASQQTELLVSLMILGTLTSALAERRWLAIVCCMLGMFCKELMVVTPLLVLIAMSFDAGLSPIQTLKQHRVFHALLWCSCLIVIVLMSCYPRTQSTGNLDGWNNWNYLLTQASVIHLYMQQTFWPNHLAIDIWMPRAHAITEVLTSIIPVGLLLVACVCSFIGKDRRAFWLALFFLVLAPTSSIIPIITEVAAERRMYLPSLGLMVFIFSAIHYVLCKYKLAKVVPVLLSCCTVALAISTFARAGVYRSQITLYEDTVAKYPNNRRAARNLGSWYYEHQQYEKSLQTYEDVLTRWPKDWHVQTDRAIVLVKLNRLEDAAHVLESIREQIANDALAMSLLGDVYRKMDQWDKAQRAYEQAIAVDKTNAYQHKTFLANAYAHQQKWLDAIHWQKQALENSAPIPRSHRAAVWNMLGMYYGITDQYELAAKAFKTALSWPKDTAPQTLEDARANLAKAMEMIQLKSQRKTQDKPTI